MKIKKIPLRRCVGCGEMKPKKELTRVVVSPDDVVSVDHTGKKAGRGAYVCRNRECLEKAYASKGLERSLKRGIPKETYEELAKDFS